MRKALFTLLVLLMVVSYGCGGTPAPVVDDIPVVPVVEDTPATALPQDLTGNVAEVDTLGEDLSDAEVDTTLDDLDSVLADW